MKRNKRTWSLTDKEMNYICMCISEAAESYKDKGCRDLAAAAESLVEAIYEMLDLVGYYSN